MDKDTFTTHDADTGWWLTRKDGVADAVVAAREEIGRHLGLASEWYADADALGKVFERLEHGDAALLGELDSVTADGDDSARAAWAEKAAAALRPAAQAPPAAAGPSAPAAPHQPDAPAHEAAPDPVEQAGDAGAPASGGEQATAEPAAAWDDARQMLYRVRDGNYEFAHSDDKATVRDGTHWMSQAEVDAEGQQAAAGSGDAWAERGIAVSYDADAGHQYQFTNADGAPVGEAMTAERATEALKEYEELKAVFADGGLNEDEMKEFAANPETSLAGVAQAFGPDEG